MDTVSDAIDASTIIATDSELLLLPKPTALSTGDIVIPDSEYSAMHGPNNLLWRAAMDKEKSKMAASSTLFVCPRSEVPATCKVVGYKWVYTVKNDECKARVTLHGFNQIEGVNFFDTSSPTVDSTTHKLFWGVVAEKKMFVLQGDVKAAFLQAEFTVAVSLFMKMPVAWAAAESPDTVLCVAKPIYGAKQASLEFHRAFTRHMETLSFQQSINDPCLFTLFTPDSWVMLIIHVDDFLLAATNEALACKIGKQIE